ncbi:hypothetical protein LOD99_8732 [Oopsacas minuta]|uniref:EGF-like domain-containing protein n=1 Tax=Oopsacas minuta TaxID=111878 RepID=A0AAV7JGM6_9METZ|nr:hypothetical protein LOD99_8732 [Oopsacas minuta]
MRCNEPWQFILIIARKGFVDTAPIPDTVPCISISEDTGTIQHLLTYTDREDDTVRYTITSVVFTQSASEYPVAVPVYSVEINDSVLCVTPPTGISGNITINLTLIETGTPAALGIPLSATSQVTVYILLKNHNPILVEEFNTRIKQYTVYIDEIGSTTQHNFTFYSYDKDKGDELIFKYKNCSYCDMITREQTPSNGNKVPTEYRNTSSKSIVEYSPTKGYYGSDEIGVVAEDNNGAYSGLLFVSLSICDRPCLNGGICKGPESDPNCSKIIRPEDFTVEYSCECTEAWSMRRCDIPHVCYSQPCPFNTSCIAKDNGEFECICQPEWPCYMYPHTDPQNTWIIAAITISCVLILILIAVLFILFFAKFRQSKPKRIVSLEISIEELREIQLERFTGDEVYCNTIESPLEQSTPL